MTINTFEVRTEEEHAGNLLLVITSNANDSNKESLKSLWITAQEYDVKTSLGIIEADYKKESLQFLLEDLNSKKVIEKVEEIFFKIESHADFEENPAGSLFMIKKYLHENLNCNSVVLSLENNFSTYIVFISNGSTKIFFSWCDVI